MATINGFTAERMLEIELGTVVSGEIRDGHLFLRTRGGDEIDAGVAKGAKGAKGDPGTGGGGGSNIVYTESPTEPASPSEGQFWNNTGAHTLSMYLNGEWIRLDNKDTAAKEHTHPVEDLEATGTPGSGTYLRGDGVWAAPAGTTYSVPSQAEAEAGTATTGRVFSAERVKQAIMALSPVKSVSGKTGVIDLETSDVDTLDVQLLNLQENKANLVHVHDMANLTGGVLKMSKSDPPPLGVAGKVVVYVKNDGALYAKQSDGTEARISPSYPSLFANPDFEDWDAGAPLGWEVFWLSNVSISQDFSTQVRGSCSLKFDISAGGNSTINTKHSTNPIAVQPGDVINLSTWAKATGGGARLNMGILTKKDGAPGYFDPDTQAQNNKISITSSWKEYRASYVVPGDHNNLIFSFKIDNTGGTAMTGWLDATSSTATSVPAGGQVMTGEIKMWPLDVAPAGYLLLDGSVYNIVDYSTLGQMLGNKYGGDGITTFAVPDMRRRFPFGADSSYPAGNSDEISTPGDRTPTHSHSAANLTTNSYSHNQASDTTATGSKSRLQGPASHSHNVTGSTGNSGGIQGGSETNRFPHLTLNYIIKT